MLLSSSNDTGDVNVPMNITVDDDDANDVEEVAPTEMKKGSSKEANSSGSKATKPPRPCLSNLPSVLSPSASL